VAITVSGGELASPGDMGQRAYRNLIYFHEVDKGGHFAAWEESELFSPELRAAFRSLR
jgi:pimeloyl-ACP methyl ester carboxylesterase